GEYSVAGWCGSGAASAAQTRCVQPGKVVAGRPADGAARYHGIEPGHLGLRMAARHHDAPDVRRNRHKSCLDSRRALSCLHGQRRDVLAETESISAGKEVERHNDFAMVPEGMR